MSYQALYRKWRPLKFDELVGQEHIVTALVNQIKNDRTSHAYLFCGTRGTGKTSTAKIFARAINCSHNQEGSPCNQCDTCQAMLAGRSFNVIEIDAASNNGVDNIREIREEVKYTPTDGRFKVYIIDEVHMLSTGAFNALLKTLEEPPPHVKFILATTEPHKIPATILSRCQRYDFKRIKTEVIANTLSLYLEAEKVEAEPKAVYYISKIADGSMRDGLSILDQCMAFYLGQKITLDKVLEVLGAVDVDIFHDLADALIHEDAIQAIERIDQVVAQGRDISQFLVDQIAYLRNLLIAKTVENHQALLDVSAEVMAKIEGQAEQVEDSRIIYLIRELSKLEAEIKYMTDKRTLIEIGMIKLCRPELNTDNQAVLYRLNTIEQQMHSNRLVEERYIEQKVQERQQATPEKPEPTEEISIQEYVKGIPQDIQKAIAQWDKLIKQVDGLLRATLQLVTPYNMQDQNITLICHGRAEKDTLSKLENKDKIVEELAKIHHKKFDINVIDENELKQRNNKTVRHTEQVLTYLRQKIDFEITIK